MNEMPPNRPIHLSNSVCVYCGEALGSGGGTKEHVVGKRFVPKGTLDGNWNLIVLACTPCNAAKADFVRIGSTISALGTTPDWNCRLQQVQ